MTVRARGSEDSSGRRSSLALGLGQGYALFLSNSPRKCSSARSSTLSTNGGVLPSFFSSGGAAPGLPWTTSRLRRRDQELIPLLVRQLHLEARVRRHAPLVGFLAVREAVDVLAARPPVALRRQLQGRVVFHRIDVLHAALAEAALADDHRPAVVLQRGRDDLAGAGAVLVDQDGDRMLGRRLEQRASGLGIVDLAPAPCGPGC